MLSLCLFNLYWEYIIQNAGLDESQAEIKMARRNINNLWYAYDNDFNCREIRKTKEPLEEAEGEWKSWLKTQQSKKTKILASGPITSWEIDGEKGEIVTDFIFLGSKITWGQWL